MIFNNSNPMKPINIPFNWAVDYLDGSSLTEFNLSSYVPNSFYNIKQDKILRFGLFSGTSRMYFESKDGHFYLNGRRIEIQYVDENNVKYNLTNNKNKKDLITYKQAYTDFDRSKIEQKTNIESINFGYKTVYNKDDIEIFFQPIVSVPSNNSVFIEIKLTSNKDLDGELVFITSGKESERFEAPLTKNTSGHINWTVK